MQTTTMIPVEIVLLPERCYRCSQVTAPVIGLSLPHGTTVDDEYLLLVEDGEGWFLQYDSDSADVIAAACPDDLLAAHGAGSLRWRTTRMAADGYLANTCCHSGTVLGNFPLHESLIEFEAEGGSLGELPRIASMLDEAVLHQPWRPAASSQS
jgi:hypothetical protein